MLFGCSEQGSDKGLGLGWIPNALADALHVLDSDASNTSPAKAPSAIAQCHDIAAPGLAHERQETPERRRVTQVGQPSAVRLCVCMVLGPARPAEAVSEPHSGHRMPMLRGDDASRQIFQLRISHAATLPHRRSAVKLAPTG